MPKRKVCWNCKHSRYYDGLFVECAKYNWKIHVNVAKQQAVCSEEELHHVFPEGRKMPVKLYKQRKVMA